MVDVGSVVAGYRLAEALGGGPFGRVFEARGPGGDVAAVKLLRPDFLARMGSEAAYSRLSASISVHSRLAHPYLARVIRPIQDPAQGACGQVSERLTGQPLGPAVVRPSALHNGDPQALATLITWFEQLGDVLAWLHEQGMVHGNLKPSNVMLVPLAGESHVKLLDLSWSAIGVAAARKGSESYVSPEQYAGQVPSAKSDQWALGTMLERIFTGGQHALSYGVLPAALVQLVQRATKESPDERFATTRELTTSLREIRVDLQSASGISPSSSHGVATMPAGAVPRDLTTPQARASTPQRPLGLSRGPDPFARPSLDALGVLDRQEGGLGAALGSSAGMSAPQGPSDQVTKRAFFRDGVPMEVPPSDADSPSWGQEATLGGPPFDGPGDSSPDHQGLGRPALRRHAVGDVLGAGEDLVDAPNGLEADLHFEAPTAQGPSLAELQGTVPGAAPAAALSETARQSLREARQPLPTPDLASSVPPTSGPRTPFSPIPPAATLPMGSPGALPRSDTPFSPPPSSTGPGGVPPSGGPSGFVPSSSPGGFPPSGGAGGFPPSSSPGVLPQSGPHAPMAVGPSMGPESTPPAAPSVPPAPPVEPAPTPRMLPTVAAGLILLGALVAGAYSVVRSPGGYELLVAAGAPAEFAARWAPAAILPVPTSTVTSTSSTAVPVSSPAVPTPAAPTQGGPTPVGPEPTPSFDPPPLERTGAQPATKPEAPRPKPAEVAPSRRQTEVDALDAHADAALSRLRRRRKSDTPSAIPARPDAGAVTTTEPDPKPAAPPTKPKAKPDAGVAPKPAPAAVADAGTAPKAAPAPNDEAGCAAGDRAACMRHGQALRKAGQRDASVTFFEKACSLGQGIGCLRAAGAYSTRPGGRDKARDLYAAGCEHGIAQGCVTAARMFEGERASALKARACELGHQDSCGDDS